MSKPLWDRRHFKKYEDRVAMRSDVEVSARLMLADENCLDKHPQHVSQWATTGPTPAANGYYCHECDKSFD
jgi:hypothetical protein